MHRFASLIACLLAAILGMDSVVVELAHTCRHHHQACAIDRTAEGASSHAHLHPHGGHRHHGRPRAGQESPERPSVPAPADDDCMACRYLCEHSQTADRVILPQAGECVADVDPLPVDAPFLAAPSLHLSRAPPCPAA